MSDAYVRLTDWLSCRTNDGGARQLGGLDWPVRSVFDSNSLTCVEAVETDDDCEDGGDDDDDDKLKESVQGRDAHTNSRNSVVDDVDVQVAVKAAYS